MPLAAVCWMDAQIFAGIGSSSAATRAAAVFAELSPGMRRSIVIVRALWQSSEIQKRRFTNGVE